jgi:hypothetical protein
LENWALAIVLVINFYFVVFCSIRFIIESIAGNMGPAFMEGFAATINAAVIVMYFEDATGMTFAEAIVWLLTYSNG